MYPNQTQRESIRKNIDACRFVYNWALETKKAVYEQDGTNLSWYDLNKQLTKLKDIHLWLKEANSQSLQQSVKRLCMAFQSFLQRFKQGKEKLGYPKFRSKRRHRQSSDVPQNFTMNFATSRVQLPKIGTIKTAIHRRIIGKLKTCTVVSTNTGRVFINIVVEDGLSAPMKPPVMKKNSLGIDLGLTTYATTSSGVKIENPRHLQNAMKRLQCLHRRMSKKKLGSKNREKARLRLAFCKKSTSLNKGGTFSINFPRI